VEQDVVVLPLTETYETLPQKTALLLQHCGLAEAPFDFLLKVDDDVYLDVSRMHARLARVAAAWGNPSVELLYGGCFNNASVVSLDPASKWVDTRFPMRTFPPYAAGPTYYLSHAAVRYLATQLRAGLLATDWRNEDASVGSWLLPARRVSRIHEEGCLRFADAAAHTYGEAPWSMHIDLLAPRQLEQSHKMPAGRTGDLRLGAVSSNGDSKHEVFMQVHWRVEHGLLVRGGCCSKSWTGE